MLADCSRGKLRGPWAGKMCATARASLCSAYLGTSHARSASFSQWACTCALHTVQECGRTIQASCQRQHVALLPFPYLAVGWSLLHGLSRCSHVQEPFSATSEVIPQRLARQEICKRTKDVKAHSPLRAYLQERAWLGQALLQSARCSLRYNHNPSSVTSVVCTPRNSSAIDNLSSVARLMQCVSSARVWRCHAPSWRQY